VIGFFAGAAAVVVGNDADSLRAELLRLEAQAARAARVGEDLNVPPDPGDTDEGFFILPVEDLTMPHTQFVAPAFEFIDEGGGLFSGQLEEAPQPYGTIEELLELVRVHADTDLVPMGHSYVLRGKPADAKRAIAFLESLRPPIHRNVVVDFEVWTKPGRQGKRMQRLQATGTIGSAFHVWHGGQVALWIDSDTEVASKASTSDPRIDIAQTGGLLSVRAEPIEGTDDLLIDLDLRTRELLGVRRQRTAQAGMLDLPDVDGRETRLEMRVKQRQWHLAASGSPRPGERRCLMVRARIVERGETR
jgi:hypothetical protein